MEKIKKILNYRVLLFLAMLIVLLTYSAIVNVTEYTHDCLSYWTKGEVMWTYGEGKVITLLNFPETFRGYFLYLLILVFKHAFGIVFGDGIWGWRFLSALVTSALFTLALPALFDIKMEKKREIAGYIALVIVLLYFCGDLIQKPGSDWIAACFYFFAVTLLKRVHYSDNRICALICAFFSGLFMYAAYNTRVVYMYAIIIAIIAVLILEIKKKFKNGYVYVGLILGMLIIAFPQMQINHQYTGEWSPKVNTAQLSGYEVDLENMQFFWGIAKPRYETYDGDLNEYEEQGVEFIDPAGLEIIEREGLDKKNVSVGKLISLFIKYPGDMVAIYTKHMASTMIPMWYENCILNLYTNKLLRITVGIWMWIILGIYFFNHFRFKKENFLIYSFVFGILFTTVGQCAGAPEIRFMVACFILAFYCICCVIKYKELWNSLSGRKVQTIIAGIIVYLLWLAILSDILAMNAHKTLLINDFLFG